MCVCTFTGSNPFILAICHLASRYWHSGTYLKTLAISSLYPMFKADLYAFGCARFVTEDYNISQLPTGQVLESLTIMFSVAMDPPYDGIADHCST